MYFNLRRLLSCVVLMTTSVLADPSDKITAKPTQNDALMAKVCRGRTPCFIAKRTASTDNNDPIKREIVYAVLDKKGAAWGQTPRWTSDGKSQECVPYEVWLVEGNEHATQQHRLLAELCNDGYGARGLGEDVFTLTDGRVTYAQSGGSNWGWSNGATFDLNTLQFTQSESSGWFSGGRQQDRTRWDWSTLRGVTRWYVDQCEWYRSGKGEGKAVPEAGFYRYRNIPQPALPEQYAQQTWRSGSLSGCALNVDSAGANGYVVTGKPGSPTDAAFDVLAVDERTVVVDVRDDAFVTSEKSWVYGDHLEVWLAPRISISHCLEEVPIPQQWGIRMSDGAVFTAHGNPKQNIGVERGQTAENSIRFKLSLPENMSTFTLVYSDSDDGVTQERLIATSQLTFAKSETMGRLRTQIKAKFGQCVMKDEALVFERTAHTASTAAPVFSR